MTIATQVVVPLAIACGQDVEELSRAGRRRLAAKSGALCDLKTGRGPQ
jgi:predicted membrane-bound mannosyltransferase